MFLNSFLSVWFVVEQTVSFKHNVGFQNTEVNYFTNISFIVLKQDINVSFYQNKC